MELLWALLVLCGAIFSLCESVPPPQTPPDDLRDGYTCNNSIPMEMFYIDDSNTGSGTHFVYSSSNMKAFIDGAHRALNRAHLASPHMPSTNNMLMYRALQLHVNHIAGKPVCVFGSMEPWVEASLIALGAALVVSVDYNRLTYDHPLVETLSYENFSEFYSPKSRFRHSFSLCVSGSSFDHDGLGRYGDPLNPDADLQSMQRVKDVLAPEGLLLLSVPIGADLVVFNLLRRYGPLRLPRLLEGWDIVDRVGWQDHLLAANTDWRRPYEPVLIVRPKAYSAHVDDAEL